METPRGRLATRQQSKLPRKEALPKVSKMPQTGLPNSSQLARELRGNPQLRRKSLRIILMGILTQQ